MGSTDLLYNLILSFAREQRRVYYLAFFKFLLSKEDAVCFVISSNVSGTLTLKFTTLYDLGIKRTQMSFLKFYFFSFFV